MTTICQSSSARLSMVCLLVAWVYALPGQARNTQALDTTAALNLYDSGSYPEFFDAIGREGVVPRDLFKEFKKDTERWLQVSDAAVRQRRTIVAASVALEIAHLLHDEPPEWPAEYLSWASRVMERAAPPIPSPVERLWHLTAIAGMEELALPWVSQRTSSCSTMACDNRLSSNPSRRCPSM